MYITQSKQVNKNQAIATSTNKGVTISYPKLQTPYNEANPPTNINFHWFGKETNNKVDLGEIKETIVDLTTPVDNVEFKTLVEEAGFEVTEKTTNTELFKILKDNGMYLVVDIESKSK